MVVNVTPEMIARFEADRKAKLAVIQAEQAQKDLEKQKKQEYFQKYYERQNATHTARVEHPCEDCNGTIRKGEKMKMRTDTMGFGWPEGVHRMTFYRHERCP